MSHFLRLFSAANKSQALLQSCNDFREAKNQSQCFEVNSEEFKKIPGAPFAYWISDAIRNLYIELDPFEVDAAIRKATKGLATTNDERFIRSFWEVKNTHWLPLAKGGAFSEFYSDIPLVINWAKNGIELKEYLDHKIGEPGQWSRWINAIDYYLRPGVTWPNSTTLDLNVRVLPKNCIFSHMGCTAFFAEDKAETILSNLAIMNSSPFRFLVSLSLGLAAEARKHYEVGTIQKIPVPNLSKRRQESLAVLANRAWSLKRRLDTIEETSHAFALPAALRARLADYNPPATEAELMRIQSEIDDIAFDLYSFSEVDRDAVQGNQDVTNDGDIEASADDEGDEEDSAASIDHTAGLLSWAVGVAFGRFDWRLATGERAAPAEPEPFDPLPAKSPGMLPDGAEPFHAHAGILVDDQGHPHDLARLVEEVLSRVDVSVPDDVRRWLRKDFFAFHLQRYSKSRRKAPIYWPLSTASGSYTLWVYYPSMNNQTLFTAVNDFLDGPNGKLTQVSRECAELRIKGSGRSRDEEKQFEALQTFEQELTDLRDTLLKIAPTYQPNHNDGVQITAAPLWPLFRHKAWQKVLKDTWTKLEKGDYDWAHLAMAYWPDRVREKCKTDKSLAIAHGLEDLYIEPEKAPKKTRGKKKAGANA
ncbi:hypothetical protein Q7I18_07180 [Aeromonas veronii]|jgi:hypothetical protein|uniref:type II restriction endonuclease subunit M n=1 Tax=Aeromonas TaxID=642 RepID=UPI000C290DE2|nr:type II restriction endonuclease subunit M [Aeromonas veronii]ATY77163.1 type II restriction endonuclease subunit M [Aeromonas veronii]